LLKLSATSRKLSENYLIEGRKNIMKKCPNCEKTFDDSMRFCQTDGTPLVEVAEEIADDPLKTTVVRQEDFASVIPPENPFENSVPVKEDSGDLLQLPEEFDPMKTVVARDDANFDLNLSEPQAETPVSQVEAVVEEKVEEISAIVPEPPKFSEPSLSPPNFGDMASPSAPVEKAPKVDDEPPPTAIYMPESSPFSTPQSPVSPFDNASSSPFDRPMEKPQDAPIPSPFDTPPPVIPTFQEPTPVQPSSPFEQPSGFGAMEQQNQGFNQPVQQSSDWTPPPAPNASWQDQGLGANTPFQPPPVSAQGQNNTMAIVALVCGILGFCCGFIGIAGVIVGFIAKGKADSDPANYGGRGMAIAGIILGAVGFLLNLIVGIIQLSIR
jgi:hypothetical protein